MSYKIKKMAEKIAKILNKKSEGHCLRINDLPESECIELCDILSENINFRTYVVYSNSKDLANNNHSNIISLDTAIELRNKKSFSLCLIFPHGVDVPASLSNTFEVFDLFNFLKEIKNDLINSLDDKIRSIIREILKVAETGLLGRDLKNQDIIDFLEIVSTTKDVNLIGNNLWMIGLIPDKSDSFLDRLNLNYHCVKEISKPSRPQITIRQRIENTKLRKGKFFDELVKFLSDYSLYPSKMWLKGISKNENFTFDKWEFPEIERSDLEEIILKKPRRSSLGLLLAGCGNIICDSSDSPLIANCGPGKKINVVWETIPKNPKNVGGWLVELIPSREDYDENESDSDLPQIISKPNQKKAKISLDFDLEDIRTKWVQIRITALDENENTIVDDQKLPIEALSERILLKEGPVDENDSKPKQFSYPNFPFGFIDLARSYRGEEEEWNAITQGWTEDENLSYYKILVNETEICRVAVSSFIKEIESKIINEPEVYGRFNYDVIDIDQFDTELVFSNKIFSDEFVANQFVRNFLDKRRDIFNKIKNKYGTNAVIEIISDFNELLTKVKNYTESYNQLINSIKESEELSAKEKKDLLFEALTIDTIELNIKYNTGDQKAVLLLPTHPYRLLWFASYSLLLDEWRRNILCLPQSQRKKSIDLDLLSQIQASNFPYILPSKILDVNDEWFIFIKNINFFVAMFLPFDCKDWSRVSSDVVSFLGYDDSYTVNEVKSSMLKEIFNEYLAINPEVKSRGINIGIVNPGSGEILASALEGLLFSKTESDFQDIPIKRINISAIANAPLPIEITALERLKQEFYFSEGITENSSALYPALSYYLSEKEEKPEFPNGNQNITIYYNDLRPKLDIMRLESYEDTEEISLYGLVNRWIARNVSDRNIYQFIYWIPFSKAARYERHPVDGTLTDYLLNSLKTLSNSLAYLINSTADENSICCLKSMIGPDEKGFIEYLHQRSDWVITIDRFLGPELFDSPIDTSISNLSEKYLINYKPNFNEGIGERMLLSTCHTDQIFSNIIHHIKKISPTNDLNVNSGIIDKILRAIKLFSGNLFSRLLIDYDNAADYDFEKSIYIGLIINNLLERKYLQNSFILPIWGSENFQYNQCDFIIVSSLSEKLVFECVCVNSSDYNEIDDIQRCFDETEKLLEDILGQEEDKVGSILNRSNLITQMRYYFRKSIRYGLIKDDIKIKKITELLSKLEFGKPLYQIKRKSFLIDINSNSENEIFEKINDVEVETHSLMSLNLIEQFINNFEDTYPQNESSEKSDDEVESNEDEKGIEIEDIILTQKNNDSEYPESAKVVLGRSNNQDILFEPSTTGSPHTLIIGIPGQGKTVTINSLLTQLTQQGIGSIVFDFHGQFSSDSNPFNNYCSPRIWDVLSEKLPFNPFKLESELDNDNLDFFIKMQSAEIADIFDYVCDLGVMQRYTLYEAIVSLYKNRMNKGEHLTININDLKRKLKQSEKDNNIKNVLARTSKLLEMNFFTDDSQWDILSTTKKGLILNLKSLGEGTMQNAISAFVLRKLYKEILHWDETNKLKLAIVLDEAHRLSKDVTLPLIMQEARKFGVMVIIASQNLNHFHPNVIGNVGTKIIFRTNSPSSNQVAQLVTLKPGKEARKIIENLKVGEALVQTPQMKYGEIVKMKYFTKK